MASKWATEKAREIADTKIDIPLYEREMDAIAAALDAARQEGKREMRERAADIVRDASSSGLLVSVEAAIRALPLEDR